MLDTLTRSQDSTAAFPTTGVRVGIHHHQQTAGRHRLRVTFDRPVADILRRGLTFPRLRFDGDMVNGLRIWCEPGAHPGSLSPVLARNGSWTVALPSHRLRGAAHVVEMTPVDIQWQLDEPGPVLLIPRLPDAMLPPAVLDKLPNSAVDPETRMARADKRLKREIAALYEDAPEIDADQPPPEPPQPEPATPAAPDGEPAPDADAAELRAAISLVNDLVDLIGDGITLAIDEHGHVTARRRVVMFVDL